MNQPNMFRNKIPLGRIIPPFFSESSESDRVFNCLHDSNSIFRARGINSEIFSGGTVVALVHSGVTASRRRDGESLLLGHERQRRRTDWVGHGQTWELQGGDSWTQTSNRRVQCHINQPWLRTPSFQVAEACGSLRMHRQPSRRQGDRMGAKGMIGEAGSPRRRTPGQSFGTAAH